MSTTLTSRCYFLMTQIVFSDHDSQLAALKCSLAQAQLARSLGNWEQIILGRHTHKQTLFWTIMKHETDQRLPSYMVEKL